MFVVILKYYNNDKLDEKCIQKDELFFKYWDT